MPFLHKELHQIIIHCVNQPLSQATQPSYIPECHISVKCEIEAAQQLQPPQEKETISFLLLYIRV